MRGTVAEYLLDASLLIDWLRNVPDAKDFLNDTVEREQVLALCCVSVSEVYAGLREQHRERVERLFSQMTYWDIPEHTASLAGDLRFGYARRGVQLATTDVLQAALAIDREAFFVTRNVKDFPMPELKLVPFPPQ